MARLLWQLYSCSKLIMLTAESRTKRPVDKKAGDGKACLFDASRYGIVGFNVPIDTL